MAFIKRKTLKTPVGIALWVCINKPSTKFKPEGEYSVTLALPADVATAMQADFKKLADEAFAGYLNDEKDAKKKALLAKYTVVVPGSEDLNDAGEPTGRVAFKFKQVAVIKPKDPKKEAFEPKIGIFDGTNSPIPSGVLVGKGSEMKIAYEAVPYAMASKKEVGVTLRLKAVQVIKLVKYGGAQNASDYGFEADDNAESYGGDGTDAPAEAGGSTTPGTGDGTEF